MLQFHIFGILLLALNGALAVTVNAKCEPTCDGVTESGTLVLDPSSCVGYYACALIGDEYILSDRLACNDGYYFNINLAPPQCDLISNAHEGFCDGYCNPCEVQCSEPSTLSPDPYNCTFYYLCLEGGGLSPAVQCGSTAPFFDYTAGLCQTEESLCYDYCDPTYPYCVEAGFVEAQDCQDYYYCEPPTLTPFTCADGYCFDLDAGTCQVE